ncbi:MAG: MBL fold metallo-hydrolase, partial [Draconibacterium sp.]|nr:MBL fold metallo-hydrolase [Draconibacterium sp.]
IIVFLGRNLKPRHASPAPFIADFTNITNYPLSDYGISGEVIHTPGHTAGSQSVLIGKTLIAGDTFFNIHEKIIFPPFANNPQQVLKTWAVLFGMGIEEIIPAHGKKFRVEKAVTEFEKWNKKLKIRG